MEAIAYLRLLVSFLIKESQLPSLLDILPSPRYNEEKSTFKKVQRGCKETENDRGACPCF